MAKSASEQAAARLELEEDLAFEKHELVMRRIGTAVLCALLLAAVAGLFGSGPLSAAEEQSSDSRLNARYERFLRNRAVSSLLLTVRSPSPGTPIQLTMNRGYAEAIAIEQILPQPSSEKASGTGYVFEFQPVAPDSALNIVVRYRPEALGALSALLSAGGSALRLRQLVYP